MSSSTVAGPSRWRLLALAAAASLAIGAPAHSEWLSRTVDGIMGTRIVVELWDDDSVHGQQSIDTVIVEMNRIDAAMSTYKPDSELSRLNARAALQPVKISTELFRLLNTSMEYSRITSGAFDVTYASVGFMYDFRARQRPDEQQIKQALPAVNYKLVALNAKQQTVRYQRAGMKIDLGGIAKGYAVDRGIEMLQARGVQHALVSAGGDSRIIGDRFGRPWVIGIRHPDRKDDVILRLPLVDTAISTSGDYERYFDEDGQRYHHIIDPRTGHSASMVRSATVLADTAVRTDGLSKTAFVLGADAAVRIYEGLGDVDAVLVTPDGKVHYTRGLEPPSPTTESAPH
jgi:thiamine biosynthesis lipoprotein